MKWNRIKDRDKARDELPKDNQFLAIWKGVPCIAQYDEDEKIFYISFHPADYEGTMSIPNERENKFTHWALIEYPEDY